MSVLIAFAPRSIPAQLALKPTPLRRLLGRQQSAAAIFQNHSTGRKWIQSQQAEVAPGSISACSWLTTTPEEITPDDVLSASPTTLSRPTSNYIPVILITPAFAHWVDPSHPFLEQWMNQCYPSSPGSVQAMVAIVDSLPKPRPESEKLTNNQSTEDYDGLSILFVNADNVRGKPVPPRQVRSVESEEASLVFSSSTGSGHSHEIGLRLARTIFVNGKENTLFVTQWTSSADSKKLVWERSIDLSTCSVALTNQAAPDSLQLPLHPVGQRRKVISSMGNILRQVTKHVDGKSNDPMPASSDLEKELPRYISEHDITSQRISVWALVEKEEDSHIAKSGYSQNILAKSIQMGGKLHRVMSGGGGWGKKQGLLSLDPETSFVQTGEEDLLAIEHLFSPSQGISSQSDKNPDPFEKAPLLEDLSTLSQVAEPGDYIQFFASAEANSTQTNLEVPGSQEQRLSCLFGVVSDVETPPNPGVQHKTLEVTPNYFGALSGNSITYMHPVEPGRGRQALESRTKLDVPGSRVELFLK